MADAFETNLEKCIEGKRVESPGEVGKEVQERIAFAGTGGGRIIISAGSLADDGRIDNVRAMSKALKKYGNY